MKTLTFNDGTTVHGYGNEEDGNLYVYIHGKTLTEAFSILNDPEKTVRMVSKVPDGTTEEGDIHMTEIVHEGYVHLKCIVEEDTSFVSATMTQ